MIPFFTYRPELLSAFVGQDEAIESITSFFDNFKPGKGLFLYGPPGCGKTSSIHAFAKQNDYEVLELNASDARNKSLLQDFLSKATGQMSLFGNKKLILLDEVDGLSGMKDRGAASAIVDYIKKSHFPIVATGVNVFDKKFSTLKKSCSLVEFDALKPSDILIVLEQTCERCQVDCDEAVLKAIARNAAGDARAALNDLFCFVVVKDTDDVTLDVRRKTEVISDVLIKVFKSTDPSVVFGAYDLVDDDLDKIFLWVDENVPKEYKKPQDLEMVYDVLSKADIFFGRIRRWQYYRFYVYCYLLLSVGVALSKKEKYKSLPSYKQPTRLLKYWQANMTYAKRKSIVEKIASVQNISKKTALQDSFPLLLPALANDKNVQEAFELTADEVAWARKTFAVVE